ncbi:unnamed protein product, partial [Phaeothamnion confervicola]
DEPVDPIPLLREKCKAKCTAPWKEYEACKERIAAKGYGDCEPQYFDFIKCSDKCVS